MGLGNPGPKYIFTPHNIGFLIVDYLAQQSSASWKAVEKTMQSEVMIENCKILLVKPMTFMNDSGNVLSTLRKQAIALEDVLVVHDEIDFDFGKISFKEGGSARGHNGLRSLIAHGGSNFLRLRCGVGRPVDVKLVGDFVTAKFEESEDEVNQLILKAAAMIVDQIRLSNLQN